MFRRNQAFRLSTGALEHVDSGIMVSCCCVPRKLDVVIISTGVLVSMFLEVPVPVYRFFGTVKRGKDSN